MTRRGAVGVPRPKDQSGPVGRSAQMLSARAILRYALVAAISAASALPSDAMTTCLELRASINGRSTHELAGLAEKVNAVCGRAFRESHLSARDFWMKYR